MRKQEFLDTLRARLADLPRQEVEERIAFYSEMIDDRMEEGMTEEDAVLAVGSVDEIAEQIASQIPLAKIAKEKLKPKRKPRAWEIVLLILGAPLWLSLLLAAFSVVISVYAAIWSVIVSLWASFGALVGGALGALAAGIVLICVGNVLAGIALIGAALILVGLSIFLFFGCKAATKGVVWLTKTVLAWIKKCFVKKEEVS